MARSAFSESSDVIIWLMNLIPGDAGCLEHTGKMDRVFSFSFVLPSCTFFCFVRK